MGKILLFTEHKYEQKCCLAPWCIWQLDLSNVISKYLFATKIKMKKSLT